MNAAISEGALKQPRTVVLLRGVKILVGCYAVLSALTLVAAYLMRDDAAMVNDTVWIRGGIVALTSLLMLFFAVGTGRGRPRAHLRLRIVSAIMVVAIAVIVAIPGFLPLWMRIEQGVCGLLLIGVVVIVNGGHLRAVFTGRG